MQVDYRFEQPLGYEQITGLGAAKSLTVPSGAVMALLTAETQGVRWRDDNTDPTAAVGYPLPAGGELQYTANLLKVRLIEMAASATVSVVYYKQGTKK